jgi:hypothetical protein
VGLLLVLRVNTNVEVVGLPTVGASGGFARVNMTVLGLEVAVTILSELLAITEN